MTAILSAYNLLSTASVGPRVSFNDARGGVNEAANSRKWISRSALEPMTGRRPAIFHGRGEMKFKKILFSVACVLQSGSIAADAQQKNALVWIQGTADAATNRAAIAFSSDGQFVASGRADSNSVQI